MSTIHDTAHKLADLVVSKRAAYGDSIPKAVAALTAIWPNGIPVDQYRNALTFARVAEKHARKAQGADAHGENPTLDAAGYELADLHDESIRKVGKQQCASASGAAHQSKAEENTAATLAESESTPRTNATSAPPSEPSRNAGSTPTSPSTAASAPSATEHARSAEDGRNVAEFFVGFLFMLIGVGTLIMSPETDRRTAIGLACFITLTGIIVSGRALVRGE